MSKPDTRACGRQSCLVNAGGPLTQRCASAAASSSSSSPTSPALSGPPAFAAWTLYPKTQPRRCAG